MSARRPHKIPLILFDHCKVVCPYLELLPGFVSPTMYETMGRVPAAGFGKCNEIVLAESMPVVIVAKDRHYLVHFAKTRPELSSDTPNTGCAAHGTLAT